MPDIIGDLEEPIEPIEPVEPVKVEPAFSKLQAVRNGVYEARNKGEVPSASLFAEVVALDSKTVVVSADNVVVDSYGKFMLGKFKELDVLTKALEQAKYNMEHNQFVDAYNVAKAAVDAKIVEITDGRIVI